MPDLKKKFRNLFLKNPLKLRISLEILFTSCTVGFRIAASTSPATQPAAINTDLALGPSLEDAEGRLLKDLEPDLRRWTAERFTLHPTAVFHQPVKLERFWQMPWKATVLYCSRAPNPGEAHLRRGADKLEADWHVIDTGHYPMLSTPDELVEVILAT